MKKSHSMGAALAAVLCILSTVAAANPIEQRQEIMEGMKDAMGVVGGMLKGKREFNAEDASVALQKMAAGAEQFGDLFPAGSEQGNDTEALPEIWTDREGFEEALSLFSTRVDTALAAEPADMASFREVATPVVKGCTNCHDDYRLDKD